MITHKKALIIHPTKTIKYLLILFIIPLLITSCGDVKKVRRDSGILSNLPHTAKSFSSAKKTLYEIIYQGHPLTFYCDCKFTKTRRVYLGTCDVKARKNNTRAKKLEAEHVFPAYHFGQFRACWRDKLCTDSKGGEIFWS
jgi:deoxyribonuclease-1